MTAEEFLIDLEKSNKMFDTIEEAQIYTMVEFAKLKVEEAVAEIARAEANSIEEANQDKEFMLTLYSLENIK